MSDHCGKNPNKCFDATHIQLLNTGKIITRPIGGII